MTTVAQLSGVIIRYVDNQFGAGLKHSALLLVRMLAGFFHNVIILYLALLNSSNPSISTFHYVCSGFLSNQYSDALIMALRLLVQSNSNGICSLTIVM